MRPSEAKATGRICAAHLNHRLRPEADDDERFVVDLCRRLGVECEVGHILVREIAHRRGEGIEAAARHARYHFLQKAAERMGARFVVTAHTADDQAETILHRVVRGTGIRGLSGMARVRRLGHASLVRPMLGVHRDELLAYLAELGQPYRNDPSNADRRFTRNRIRHALLPRLREQFNPEVVDALLRLGSLAGEAQAVIDAQVETLVERCLVTDGPDLVVLQLGALTGRPPYVVRELLAYVWRRRHWPMQSMGATQWGELASMASQSGSTAKRDFPGGVSVQISDGRMLLSRRQTPTF